MKRIICLLFDIIFCAFLFAVDIRQVMFGNNYENINEIDNNIFFNEYPDVKHYVENINFKDFEIIGNKTENYYRVFEQVICGKKFVHVVRGKMSLTDDYIKEWRNPDKINTHNYHAYFKQLFYLPNDKSSIAILPICMMDADGFGWENGSNNKYEMIELIHRNGKIKGFMHVSVEDRIDYHNRTDSNGIMTEKYINRAKYFLFDDVIKNATENFGKIKYVGNYKNLPFVLIESDQPLIDKKLPFKYTIQNLFDGNLRTAYVENTEDDLMFISLYREDFDNISKVKIVNGYCLNQNIYNMNNRIKGIGGHYFNGETREYYSKSFIRIRDEFSSIQIVTDWYSSILPVSEIYEGTKYKDTCISELDFFDDNYGWIIGE